jgi:outer membrane immunogenic protein
MKLNVSSSAIALALALVSAPALAADLGSIKDTYEEPPPPVVSWTGFYVSGGLGGSYMFTDLEGAAGAFAAGDDPLIDPPVVAVGTSGDVGAANFFGTVGLGYDFQMAPKWLFGVLADYDFASSQDASVSGGGAISLGQGVDGAAGVTVSSEMGDTWSVGARLGYLINPRTLVYALGGYSEAEFSLGGTVTVSGIPNDGPYSVSSGKSWRQGYFVGGGLESMLAENLSAKLEYRYAQYDGGSFDIEETVSGGPLDGATVLGGASMSDPDVHSIRAALSWRFGNWGR